MVLQRLIKLAVFGIAAFLVIGSGTTILPQQLDLKIEGLRVDSDLW